MTKLLFTLLKYACPLLLVAGPCTVALDIASPWPVAEEALGSDAASRTLLVGWAYRAHSSDTVTHERREQTYAVMPTLKTITVIQEDGKVRTEENAHGLLSTLAMYASAVFGTWWFWLRKKPAEGAKARGR